ncbi:hypothetical protein ACFRCW_36175 [Streptomyces sp. NPDC056653]|uniref:hypothetical protein n=1 Tax=Streptomyces sp. NPDC056653 TaxID=3345894 RepID=UPI0036B7F60E
MKGLVVIDPEAPGGYRRVSYGLRVDGQTLRSPAMRKLIRGLVRDAEKANLEKALMEEWIQRELATAPPLTALQTQMLRRVKGDLIRAARRRREGSEHRAA